MSKPVVNKSVIASRPSLWGEAEKRLIIIGYALVHSEDRSTKSQNELHCEQDSASMSMNVYHNGEIEASFTYSRSMEYYLLAVAYMLVNHGNIGWYEDALKRMRREV